MQAFSTKQPIHYLEPYSQMMVDIVAEITVFNKRHKIMANYVILHPSDAEQLFNELRKARQLPGKDPTKFQIMGAKLIRSEDMRQGLFDVVGN